jgi:nucleotide-binding universal stress UspA family protein
MQEWGGMLRAGRILAVFGGQVPDDSLIRYAAMAARIGRPEMEQCERHSVRRGIVPARSHSTPGPLWQSYARAGDCARAAREFPEIRFVSVLPHMERTAISLRRAVADKVSQHFSGRTEYGAVTVDVLKGRSLEHLRTLADDFDADFVLLEHHAEARSSYGRFAVEVSCPVWLVPLDWAPVVRRILVPIDFSCRAAMGLYTAVELAHRFRPATCIALHVDRCEGSMSDNSVSAARGRELDAEFRRFVAAIDTRGIRIEPRFAKSYHVDRAIERAARNDATDLTVMICRPRKRLASAVHPSLAERVIAESTGPILLLKSPERPLELFEAVREHLRSAESPQFS